MANRCPSLPCLPTAPEIAGPKKRQAVIKARVSGKRRKSAVYLSLCPDGWLACSWRDGQPDPRTPLSFCRPAFDGTNRPRKRLVFLFSALAYTLVEALPHITLRGTVWAKAEVGTLRFHPFQIDSPLWLGVRRALPSLGGAYPWKSLFLHTCQPLR